MVQFVTIRISSLVIDDTRNNFKLHCTAGEILPSICRNYEDERISQKSTSLCKSVASIVTN
ncbi:hypothetical protein T4E_9231 [Trichinella pseudospiralis]|uniref:Uncharacterized protein n=1 Tax=Trichinella pseudospiralis TaxID=6337 RepID=A0A0V0XVM5_TRIPS|nr:hypothetical protein T4E_9231 [Trichinella pseudospiralis]